MIERVLSEVSVRRLFSGMHVTALTIVTVGDSGSATPSRERDVELFVAVPTRVEESRTSRVKPVANGLLVVLNVLAFS